MPTQHHKVPGRWPHYDKQIRGGEMREGEVELFIPCGKTWKGRNEGSEEWADMGSLLTTLGHVDVHAQLLPRAISGSLVLQ